MGIQIRRATPDDFTQIHALITEFAAFVKTPEKVTTTVAQMTEDRDYFSAFIALDNEKTVGFATFFFAYYSWSGKALYLDDLFVRENYRGQGIGNRLLDAVIETARAKSCKKLRWQVSAWNAKAIAFYRKKGAEIDEVEINCDLKI